MAEVRVQRIFRLVDYLVNRCPSCGVSAISVCTRCWYVLNETLDPHAGHGLMVIDDDPFVQRTLYRWDDRQIEPSSVLRELILSSKENPSRALIDVWAHEFYRRGLVEGLFAARRDWVVIPPPGRSGRGEEDHAGALVTALTKLSGGTLRCELQALERVGESRRSKNRAKSQKTKSREERSAIEFRVSESMKPHLECVKGFIFIDDVIATGATAKAAWIALGRPKSFESWAIAWKVNELDTILGI